MSLFQLINIVKLFQLICTPLICTPLMCATLYAPIFLSLNKDGTTHFSVFVVSLNVTTFCDVCGFFNSDPSVNEKESSRPLPMDGSLAEVLHHYFARSAFEVIF